MTLEAQHLTRRFCDRTAVDSMSCTLPPGQVVALLGANGSGKTTSLNLLATLLEPSEGAALVAGRGILGFTPQR